MGIRIAKWEHRTLKREQALARKAECDKLTASQRLARLNQEYHIATRERERLLKASAPAIRKVLLLQIGEPSYGEA